MGIYSIRDLEQLSNIKAHTLRVWEQRYNLLSPKRTPTKIRYYDDDDLKKILNVSFLKSNGHRISQIASLSDQELALKVKEIVDEDLDFPSQVNALVIAMVDLDELYFEKIISTSSLQLGFEACMINIVFPFLSRIGVLWQTGSINPAHEHFISSLIRQKVIVAIDGQIHAPSKDAKKYALYLPEGEYHEIGLLFAAYIIKSRQQRIIYLGQSLPLADLSSACKAYKPDYVFTLFTNCPTRDDIEDYIKELRDGLPETQLIISGHQAITNESLIHDDIHIMKDFDDMVTFVEENRA